MRPLRTFPLCFLAALLLTAIVAKPQATTPTVRIVNAIDENNLVTLKGNTHPLANAKNDRGQVSPSLPMTDLILLLSRSPEQQAAFDKFVASQYDPHSPDFHHWLEPAQVGEFFGPSPTDIQTLSNWLAGHGFSVDAVSKDRMTIRFSGTAGQVESTFHTEIHNLEVGAVPHIANMSDPQIPAALAPAVVGVKGLHNFFPRPMHKLGGTVQFNREAGKWQRIPDATGSILPSAKTFAPALAHPEFGIQVGSGSTGYLVEDVAPYDFATIYNVLPLWNAATPIDGTGQKIAIAGTSNINLNDVTAFRSTFGLPAYTSSNQPQVIIAHGTDPGDCPTAASSCDGDLTENSLDVEWSGAVAKGAQIILVVSGATSASDDTVYDSSDYGVENKTAPVLSVSYGQCELFEGTTSNAAYNAMWQTAASQGISVFVAAGDGGSALCDDGMDDQFGTPWAAQYGLAVNGLASSQYDTAVGGTDFNWGSTAAPYWGTTNSSTTGANALGYVQEIPWNDTCTNPLALNYIESIPTQVKWSGNAVTDAETACNFIANDSIYIFQNYTQNGSPVDISYFVDTVGGSGGASNCSTNTTTFGTTTFTPGTCTSGYAKPTWQTALTPTDSARDLPDVSFFASNGFLGSATLICVSANGACVTSTTLTTEPTAQEIGGTSVASPAMAGVMALINQKAAGAQGSPNAELYTLAGKQTYSSCSAETVTAGSTSCYFNDIDTGTISMPCDYGATDGGILDTTGTPTLDVSDEQAGIKSPNCSPTHSGDTVGILAGVNAATGYDLATGLGSLNVANVVNGWTAAVVSPSFSVSGTSVNVADGATTGNTSAISVTPYGGFTGTVNFSCAVTATPTGAVSPITCTSPSSVSVTGTTAVTATTPLAIASTATTTAGAYAVTVTGISGSLTETGVVNVTVTNPNATFTMTASAASPASVAPGGTAISNVTVNTSNGYAGTVVLSCAQTSGPSNASGDAPLCDVTLSGVAVGSSTPVTVLTIASVTSELKWPGLGGKGRGWTGAGGGAVLAFLVFLGIPARRRSWRSMLGMVLALAALGGLAACGGGGGGGQQTTNPGTAAGTYTFTVTGTGNPTVTPAPTTTFTVVVN
jgi:subtilase family serine protease